jgi:hypothetical protein
MKAKRGIGLEGIEPDTFYDSSLAGSPRAL